MKNWLGIEETEKGMRNSFLINKKPTQIEIYGTKGLFKEIQEIATTIKTLSKGLRSSGFKSGIKTQIEEETVRLLFVFELLNEIIRGNEGLQERFIFDIVKAKRTVSKILERVADSSSVDPMLPKEDDEEEVKRNLIHFFSV